jgi:DNA polymerase III delta subunit
MIYFFYGPNDWQTQQEVQALEKKQPDLPKDRIDVEARDLEPGQFSNSLTTSDFFSSAKIIKIYNLSKSKHKDQIEELLHNLNFDQNNI